MKRVYSNIFRLLNVAVIAFLFSLTGCISEQFGPDDGKCPIQNKDAEVLLKISTPKAMPKTKMTDQEEKNIDQLVVLAFAVETSGSAEKEKFLYRAPIVAIEKDPHNASITNIKVKLVVRDDLNQKVRLLIVANSEYKEIAKGTEKLAALEEYIYEYDATKGWTKNNLPMYGETAEIIIKDGAVNNNVIKDIKGDNNIQLTRSLGKIHVTLDPGIKNFKLESVHVHRMANKYSVSHYWTPESITSINYNVDTKYKVDYSGDARGYTKNKIYVAERGAGKANDMKTRPCLVLGGKFAADGNFSGKKTTYYKVEFVKGDLTNPTYLPIKRNTVYDFQVSKISGDGFVDPDDALKSKGENIKCEIVAWDDSGVEKIVTDGEWMLAVSKDEFEFYRDEDDEQIIVRTNWPDGWTAEVTEGASWLSIDKKKDVADKDCALNISVSDLTQSTKREGKITIKAGRLSWILKVVQLPKIKLRLTLYEDVKCTKEVSFYALNPSGETKRLYVKYSPKASEFNFESVSGTNFTWTKIEEKSKPGFVVYDVISSDISNSDNYFDTRTDVRLFKMATEGQELHTLMIAQQMRLDAVPYDCKYDESGLIEDEIGETLLDNKKTYYLDGTTQHFYMKANTPYKLELVENKSLMSDEKLLAEIFGISTSNQQLFYSSIGTLKGEKMKFKSYDDRDEVKRIFGEAKFKITSPENLFAPKEFTIKLSTGVIQPEANCYVLKTNTDKGILIPVSRVNTASDWYKDFVDEIFNKGLNNNVKSRDYFYLDKLAQDDNWKVKILWSEVVVADNQYPKYQIKPVVGKQSCVLSKISSTGRGCGYIYVRAGSKVGNVSIALVNSKTNKILWSWHLWVLENYPWHNDLKLELETGRSNFKYLNRDLGSLGGEKYYNNNEHYTTLLYQWGRKDPFPMVKAKVTEDLDEMYFDNTRKLIKSTGGKAAMRASSEQNYGDYGLTEVLPIKFSINNPDYAISCGKECLWYEELNKHTFKKDDFGFDDYTHLKIWSQLWGGGISNGQDSRENYNIPTVKTPFDPSPYGWKVPNTGTDIDKGYIGKESSILHQINQTKYDYNVGTFYYPYSYRKGPKQLPSGILGMHIRFVSTVTSWDSSAGTLSNRLTTYDLCEGLSRGTLAVVRSTYNDKEADFWKYLPDADEVGKLPK